MNNYQKRRFSYRITQCLFSTVTNKRIAILGFAYKANTGDTRETPAKFVCKHLLEEGARLSIYDPKVPKNQIIQYAISFLINFLIFFTFRDLSVFDLNLGSKSLFDLLEIVDSPQEASRNAHALVICTEWPEFLVRTICFIIKNIYFFCFIFCFFKSHKGIKL